MKSRIVSVMALAGLLGVASFAQAGLAPGVYRLANHPDGGAQPPRYGLRLDELYNATSSNDIFTFDFDDAQSSVFLTVTATSLTITGQAFGGRDTGNGYANDQFRGVYSFNFVYNVGVSTVPGDDDIFVDAPNLSNFGSILTPLGDTFALADHRNGSDGTFRLGNENNDLGHRGFDGISGFGWLAIQRVAGGQFIRDAGNADDFLFTVVIPTPGSAALLGLGALAATRRRR